MYFPCDSAYVEKALKFKDLEKDLKSMAPLWYNFGLQLKMKIETLNEINGEASNCLRKVLQEWLKGSYEPCTKQVLLEALREIGNGRLAGEIKENTGKPNGVIECFLMHVS